MKRILLSLLFVLVAMTSFAKSAEHLTFKGVPIDGTLSDFVAKMKNEGFTYLGEKNGSAFLDGDFAGFRACTIYVSSLKAVNVVSMVAVMFPSRKDWDSLEGDYEQLKSMLTQKYGEPSRVVERFTGSQPEDNNDKSNELYAGRCIWGTRYETKNGEIELTLQTIRNVGPCVLLKYDDKINTDKVRAAAIEDL